MTSPRRALLFSFLDRYSGLAISIVSSMVLARLLTPSQTGTFSVAMSAIAFAAVFRDLGAGQYLLQEREVTGDRVRAVWAIQLGIGLFLALVILLAAYPAAWYFREPELTAIFGVLALNYVVNPFGSITYAWLMREMQFRTLALIRFSSAFVNAVVAIYLAWLGVGAISLAWGGLAGLVTQTLIATFYRPAHFPWMPGLREIRRVLSYGARLTGSAILTTVREYIPELVIARAHGMTSAGFFSRANGVLGLSTRLVIDGSFGVAQAYFARCYRENTGLSEPLLRTLSYITVVAWSLVGMLAVAAEPLVYVLYGAQWGASAELLRWLAIGGAAMAPTGICIALLMSSGGATLQLRLTLISCMLVGLAVLVGAPTSVVLACQCIALANVVGAAVWIRYTCLHAGLSLRLVAVPLLRGAAVAGCVVVTAFGLMQAQSRAGIHAFPTLLGVGLGSGMTFLLALRFTGHPFWPEVVFVAKALRQRLPLHMRGAQR